MKKGLASRLIAVFLAVLMIINLISNTVYAEGPPPDIAVESSAESLVSEEPAAEEIQERDTVVEETSADEDPEGGGRNAGRRNA